MSNELISNITKKFQIAIKLIFMIFITFGFLVCIKNFFNIEHKILAYIPNINYGIDIKGGTNITYQVNFEEFIIEKHQELIQKIKQLEPDAQLRFDKTSGNIIFGQNIRNLETILYKIEPNLFEISYKGNQQVIFLNNIQKKQLQADVLERFVQIARLRVDNLGIKEIIVKNIDGDKFVVEIPEGGNVEQIKSIISKTAKLRFHLIHEQQYITTNQNHPLKNNQRLIESFEQQESDLKFYYIIDKDPVLYGKNIKNATVGHNITGYAINFELDAEGTFLFAKVTKENRDIPLAIVLDNKLITSPMIREPILNGFGSISGKFSLEEANQLAVLLKSGEFPISVEFTNQTTINPSLGKTYLKKTEIACISGIMLVMLFMIIVYRKEGLVANIAMIMNLATTVTFFAILGLTFTLPSIAGLVLTFGMSVDANILIYEQFQNSKLPRRQAIQEAFSNAFHAIVDSNITTIIVSCMFLSFGIGFMRGFGITIIIGSLCSMFYSCYVSKKLLTWVYR